MSAALFLEPDSEKASLINSVIDFQNLDAIVVSTSYEAIKLLEGGGVTQFCTDILGDDQINFSLEAIRKALDTKYCEIVISTSLPMRALIKRVATEFPEDWTRFDLHSYSEQDASKKERWGRSFRVEF